LKSARLGVIGGTGLYQIEGLTDIDVFDLTTPFGKPSDAIAAGRLGPTTIAFLPRHGKGHHILPSELPSRANIYALKMLGVEYIIAINAVGSLKENIRPGEIVIPDQYIDKTTRRINSFFGEGLVAHINFSEPVCPSLSGVLYEAALEVGVQAHQRGTYVVMEGPAFSTRAESLLHRSWGADIIGMTALPEAKLAREAEICYSTIACVTDYDSWRESTESVSVELILKILKQNAHFSREIIKIASNRIPSRDNCGCAQALKNTIVTDPSLINSRKKMEVQLIAGKYFE